MIKRERQREYDKERMAKRVWQREWQREDDKNYITKNKWEIEIEKEILRKKNISKRNEEERMTMR